jgi:hypothetical protein
MNIKEAGRYANFLSGIITDITLYLHKQDHYANTKEIHMKSKSYPDACDEEILVVSDSKLPYSIADIAHLCVAVIDEKQKLALAIEKAKMDTTIAWHLSGNNISIDSGVEYNKQTRLAAQILKTLTTAKNSETTKTGTSKKFNVEGNQVAYTYDTKIVKTIDFDRDIINNLHKKLLDTTDIISKKIDEAMLADIVVFTPMFSIHDTFEEVILTYMASRE